MVFELLRLACEAPMQADGVRRSRGVIVRNTLQQIKTTCLVTIEQLLRPIVHFKVSDATVQLRMPGVEADWLLLPLDTVENQQRLLSLELTYAWLSEFREIDHEIAQAVLSRCGRYPSRAMLTPEQYDYHYGMILETNSFSEDSPWYEVLEEELPSNWSYHIQPSAYDPKGENLENLPPSYYEDLTASNSEAWCEQYIENRITPSLSGQAVFRNSFSPDFHISDTELRPVPGYPLIVGVDSGRTPAAVICQLDNIGRLLVLQSIVTQKHESMGMIKFLEERLRPALQHERLVGNSAFLIVDPAAVAKSQIGESSVIEAIHEAGFQVIKALTNDIDPRLRAVEKYLSEQRNGGAAVLFDAVWTHELILAMQSKYRYRIKKDKSMEEKPDKTHPWSDVCFVAGTRVATPAGDVLIEDLELGDMVLTPDGQQPVVAIAHRGVNEVIELEISTGQTIRCTPNHPFVMADGCVLQAGALQYGDVLEDISWRKTANNGSVGSDIAATQATTTSGTSAGRTVRSVAAPYTETLGYPITAPFQTGMWYITRTTTPLTIPLGIWSWLKTPSTAGTTGYFGQIYAFLKQHGMRQRSGTAAKKGSHGTGSMGNRRGKGERPGSMIVPTVANLIQRYMEPVKKAFVAPLASLQRAEQAVLMTKHGSVRSAAVRSDATNTPRQKPVVKVVGVKRCLEENVVYNLTVDVEHRYYVEGVLVLNCDALQYACLGTNSGLRGRMMRTTKPVPVREPTAAGWT